MLQIIAVFSQKKCNSQLLSIPDVYDILNNDMSNTNQNT